MYSLKLPDMQRKQVKVKILVVSSPYLIVEMCQQPSAHD